MSTPISETPPFSEKVYQCFKAVLLETYFLPFDHERWKLLIFAFTNDVATEMKLPSGDLEDIYPTAFQLVYDILGTEDSEIAKIHIARFLFELSAEFRDLDSNDAEKKILNYLNY